MMLFAAVSQRLCRTAIITIGALGILLSLSAPAAAGEPAEAKGLRIGASSTLHMGISEAKEKVALESLQSFIKQETDLENTILHVKGWSELAESIAKGRFQLGVFPGYEFAWAQEKYPKLKPLALALNTHRYPVACVVVRKNNPSVDFTGLKGQPFALCPTEQSHVRLFLERQLQAAGKKAEDYFSKITTPDNSEDALDDVVDGVVQATIVDRAGLEAYKRRKPGRFNQLKELTHSPAFPPSVVTYYEAGLDPKTRQRFKEGLLGANRKEKGQALLTLFRLTGFEGIPEDFERVLRESRKAFPAETVSK